MTNELEPRLSARESIGPFANWDALFDDLHARLFAPLSVRVTSLWSDAPSFFADAGSAPTWPRVAPTDVTDTGKSYRLTAEIPGIPKDKIEIRIKGSRVEIEGKSATTTESGSPGWVHRERASAGFYRAVELPEPVKASEAKATLKDGLLELELPKVEPTPAPDEVKIPVQ